MNDSRATSFDAPRPSADEVQTATDVVLAARRGRLGPAREAWSHPSPRVRRAALRALHDAGQLAESALADACADGDPTVRRDAAEIAAGHPGVPLTALLADADSRVVEMACWAAGERPTETGTNHPVDELRTIAASHADALCREAAVAALGAIGRPDALPTVLAALDDRATVRRRAVVALAAFEGAEVEAALARARTDRDWQVRQAAEDLLDGEPAP